MNIPLVAGERRWRGGTNSEFKDFTIFIASEGS